MLSYPVERVRTLLSNVPLQQQETAFQASQRLNYKLSVDSFSNCTTDILRSATQGVAYLVYE